MSTTSNSRVDLRAAALTALLLGGCATSAPVADPESPAPAVAEPAVRPRRVVAQPAAPSLDQPTEVEAATIRRAEEVPELLARLRTNTGDASPLAVIDVRTSTDVGAEARSAYPVIVLNGTPLTETRVIEGRRLAVLVPASRLRGENAVSVTWIGDPSKASRRTMTVRAP